MQSPPKLLIINHLRALFCPTPTGADDERSETFAPPFGWAENRPSGASNLSPEKPPTQREPRTHFRVKPNAKHDRLILYRTRSQNPDCRDALPVARTLTYKHFMSDHPTPTGADDERSETFAPPFGWAERLTSGASNL